MRQLRTNRTAGRWAAALLVAGSGLLGLAACTSAQSTAGAAGSACGTTRTGANVPVVIKVTKGTVDCPTVLRVEEATWAQMCSAATGSSLAIRIA